MLYRSIIKEIRESVDRAIHKVVRIIFYNYRVSIS
jgi:hypothetical protein